MKIKAHDLYVKAATILLIISSLTACGSNEPQESISNELGISVSGGEEISNLDTQEGFHGDGITFTALKFSDDSVLEEILENDQWRAFPLDDTVKALIYGISDETSSIGPYVSDDEGNGIVPEVQEGYYIFIDRQSEQGDILSRASFNFTVGIYDLTSDILYFCRFDT